MKFTSLATTLITVLLLAWTPGFAAAQTQDTGPIRIDSSQIVPLAADITGSGTVTVSFTNVGKLTATQVVFGISHGDDLVDAITDAGKFSPKASITHIYSFLVYGSSKSFDLKVLSVTFADGSRWDGAENGAP
jgi:hypothetical protein